MNEVINKNKGVSKGLWLAVVVLIIVLDQLSKYLCEKYLGSTPVTVFPGFDLWLMHNSGAAFSFLNDAGGWQRWVLTLSSVVISGVILVWLLRLPKSQLLLSFAFTFILGGAIGNLIDRAMVGSVVDFISVYYGDHRFATFNLADSAISLGAALMLLDMFLGKSDEPAKESSKASDENMAK